MSSPSRPLFRRATRLAVFVAACSLPLVCMAAEGLGQDLIVGALPAQQGGNVNPENFNGKESTEGVYVPESEMAMEKFALAQKMERLKEWNKSADLYQEVLTKYPDRVVPSKYDKDQRIYQYTSVTELVMQKLAKWPQEGLDVYRARYETPATQMLEGKHDDQYTLHQVFAKYFVTDSGKQAGIRLMDLALERGEFDAAAWIGDRLLAWHPNVIVERPALRYRTAIAYHLAGNEAKAKARLDELTKQNGQDKGVVRGKEVVLADELAQELQTPISVATAANNGESYLTSLGGTPDHDLIPAAGGKPGARLYSIPLSKFTAPSNVPTQQKQLLEGSFKQMLSNGLTLGVMPVVDRGELFFQDGQRVYATSLESGVPLPGWQQTYGSDRNGQFVLAGASSAPRDHQLTLTLTDRYVLGVMGEPDPQAVQFGAQVQTQDKLVCLDRASGRDLWTVSANQLPIEQLKSLQFMGSPLVVGDSVLVIGHSEKQAGFEDCYVLCFDVQHGKYRWNCDIASASTAANPWGMPTLPPKNTSHLAYANGRVYVQTNRGAVAAVDAYSGSIVWLNIYPRGQQATGNVAFNPWVQQNQIQPQNQTKPWSYNPVIVHDGKLFTLPLEGKNLLIYDAGTGEEVKRIDMDDLAERARTDPNSERDALDTMIGITGDKLAVCGSKQIVLFNWKTFDNEHFNDDMLFWAESVPKQIRGRPFMTASAVFVPAEDRLFRFDLASGRAGDPYPNYSRSGWDEGEGPGNVLVTSDHVILSGADAVDVYTDIDAAKAKLDREVAEAPADPQPRLRYSEVMFAAGDGDASITKLDEAIKLLGGPNAMQPGPARDRVFNDALTFAQKMEKNISDDHPDVRERVVKLFDRAGASADSPQDQVHYRLSRAKFEAAHDPAISVKLYQQILNEPSLRAVPLMDEANNNQPTQAEAVAEKSIDELVKGNPTLYQAFEELAQAAFKEAQASKDPAKLLDVSQRYPNSAVAGPAMLAAAESFEIANDTAQGDAGRVEGAHEARRVLLQMYFKYPNSPQKAQILESIARTSLAIPGYAQAAAARLSQGVQSLGDPALTKPLKLPDGKEIGAGTKFSAALDVVRKVIGQEAVKTLPDFRLPVPQPHQRHPKPFLPQQLVINNVDALALPLREFARADRVVTWSTAPTLSIYASGSDKPLAATNQFTEQPRNVAWLGNDVLVWGGSQIGLIHADGAKLAWKLDVSKLQVIEVVAGETADAAPQPDQIAINNRMVRLRGRAMMMRGVVVQQPAVAAPRPVAGPEQIVEVRPVGDRVLVSTTTGRLLSAELVNGHIAWETRLTDRPLDRVVADEDFTVAKASDDNTVRLIVMDTYTGQMRGTKAFPMQGSGVPMNVALSVDGTLVYTLPDKIVLKDLYKPWAEREKEQVAQQGQQVFNGATQPDQLVIAEGRILALADNGNEKYVRLYSLETGEPVSLPYNNDGQRVDRVLGADTKSWNVSLRLVGPHLYVVAPDKVISYNLDRPGETWTSTIGPQDTVNVRDAFVGQEYVVLLDDQGAPNVAAAANQPAAVQVQVGVVNAPPGGLVIAPNPPAVAPANNAAPQPPPLSNLYRLHAFGRYAVSEKNPAESGRLDHVKDVTDPAGITTSWQPADGGFYFLTADHKLHMLIGARGAEAKK